MLHAEALALRCLFVGTALIQETDQDIPNSCSQARRHAAWYAYRQYHPIFVFMAATPREMTSRQCEIAAESFAASLLARVGFDILVQYGANQPDYDLVADKDGSLLRVSVKGSQTGAWMLASRYVKPSAGISYHQAIDLWLQAQHPDVVFLLVQFRDVALSQSPRVYVAGAREIAEQLKIQRNGNGGGALQESVKRFRPKSKYDHAVPATWEFSADRMVCIMRAHASKSPTAVRKPA